MPPGTPSEPLKRTSKEMKRWQQEQERSRRRYMKENDIKLEDVLTVEKYKEYKRLNYTGSYIRREYTGQSYVEYREWCRASGVTP
jgi:hypothetical protein